MIERLTAIFALLHITDGAFKGWVDPDTLESNRTIKSFTDGKVYDIVMSDEFERNGRSFKNGDDPMWTGIDRSDDDQTSSGRKSLQFYNSSYIGTKSGHLVIRSTTEDTHWRGWNPYLKKYDTMVRHFRSGMLQGWNKFCYTGGILEIRLQLPGRSDIGGLWPAVWLLGNLGRATFEASTNLMWPWSYEECDRNKQKAQEISGCDITSHFSMPPKKGRGATEIDLVEVMAGPSTKLPIVKNNVRRPYVSMTLQTAPGIPASERRPFPGTLPEWGFNWYENITYGKNTSINPYFYGTYLAATKTLEPIARSKEESYQCDAIGSMVQLTEDHFDNFHTFRLEWQPGADGYIHWYMDDEFRFGVEADGLKKMDTIIPNEPSYIIMNTAISTSWGFPNPPPGCTEYDCKDTTKQCGMNPGWCKTLPAEFKIDYVRVYQNKDDPRQTIGCNPKEYPTKRFILAHEYRYKVATDVHALKPVNTGGEHCANDSMCGEGHCSGGLFPRCECHDDWTGPRCLVPNYQNPFKDWDSEHWIPFKLPFIPWFLCLAAAGFTAALGVTTWFALKRRREARAGVWIRVEDEESYFGR